MDEQPKKRRRLLIIDVDDTGDVVSKPPVLTPVVVLTPGRIHSQAQQEVLRQCREAKIDEEKIEDRIWIKVDEILKATTVEEAQTIYKVVMTSVSMYFIMNRKYPEKQVKAAKRIAKMYRNKGDDVNADKQLAKAKKIQAEIDSELKQKQQ